MTQQETINRIAQLADNIQVLRREYNTAQRKTEEARIIEDQLYVKLYHAKDELCKIVNQINHGPLT